MTFQHETVSTSTIASSQNKAHGESGSVGVPVLRFFKRLAASFWRHTDTMGKTDTKSFDGLL